MYESSANGPSLNDCLFKGLKFNQLNFDVLAPFRAYKVALTAVLEKAFLMVSIEEADCDVLQFLWVKDFNHLTSLFSNSHMLYSPLFHQVRFS